MRHAALPRLLAAALLAAGTLAASTVLAARKPLPITTDEAFDAAAIPAYAGDHAAVYADIDAHREAHVAHLQRWVRQRSISTQDDGVREMAELVAGDLRQLGFKEVELVETDGHPGVFGHYDAGADTTLLVYMMYDVQPIEENWRIDDPFAGTLVDHEVGKVLMARGATNQKGPQRAFLNALESIIRVDGKLPVNLYVVAEGEEELGSPHFDQVLAPYVERLRQADAAFFPGNIQTADGTTSLSLGVKGIVYFELESRGGDWGGPARAEIHSSYKALVDAPALRLVQAIASLTTPDGNTIAVPGYYDGVRPPSLDEQRMLNALAARATDRARQQAMGVSRWIDGIEGRDALLRQLYDPTLNIDGIWSGYTGPGVKTILPHIATAKLDSRLPPGLEPEDAYRMIRRHLDAGGFRDVALRRLAGYPAAFTPVTEPMVANVIGVLNKYGATPRVTPWVAGSAPFYHFTRTLDLPFVSGSLGHGAGAHAPDEYMLVEPAPGTRAAGLADVEKAYADIVYALSELGGAGR